ncbi:MAG: hypothetical protein QME66_04270 [Candidatus Eisenbacteria bacterium]|nr:hypothetical protein [Candidatus Eisenbacteria bacterium]
MTDEELREQVSKVLRITAQCCGCRAWRTRVDDVVELIQAAEQRGYARAANTYMLHGEEERIKEAEERSRKQFADELAYSNDWRVLIEAELEKGQV